MGNLITRVLTKRLQAKQAVEYVTRVTAQGAWVDIEVAELFRCFDNIAFAMARCAHMTKEVPSDCVELFGLFMSFVNRLSDERKDSYKSSIRRIGMDFWYAWDRRVPSDRLTAYLSRRRVRC